MPPSSVGRGYGRGTSWICLESGLSCVFSQQFVAHIIISFTCLLFSNASSVPLDPSHRSPVQALGALGRAKAAANFRPSLANLVRARTKRAVVTLGARRTEAIQATTKVAIPEMMVIVNLDHHRARNNARRNLGSAREVIDHLFIMVGDGHERFVNLIHQVN